MKKLFYILLSLILIACHKKDDLSEMNNISMPEYEELISSVSSKEVLRILVVGNSITSHGKALDIGWNHKSGMAATQESKDYVHLLFTKLKSKFPNKKIYLRYSNWSRFERSPTTFSGFQSAKDFHPDIIIFQLSDNLSSDSAYSFTSLSVNFLNSFKSKYVVSPFFINSFNYNVSKKIASESNSHFIDISNIANDKSNRASNDIRNDKSQWKSEGISEHPGNVGMINIANSIYSAITSQMH